MLKLAPRKALNFKKLASKILRDKSVSIRDFAKLIGKMVAAEPGVQYAALHYKTLEIDKDKALKLNRGNFDNHMYISKESKKGIVWWINNIETAHRPITYGSMTRRIETDSSLLGYGGHEVTNDLEFSGLRSQEDKKYHINYLELKAAFCV